MGIGIKFDDDDGVNGFTEDWSEVERVCRRLDKARPTSFFYKAIILR